MHIALASQTDLPAWEVDDHHLLTALAARGLQAHVRPWDAPDVDWGSFDACLVRTTWDYHERPSAFLCWAQTVAAATRLYNPLAILRWNLDKRYLQELAALGFPCIPTVWLESGTRADLGELMTSRGWTRGMLKRQVGASAIGSLAFVADRKHLANDTPTGPFEQVARTAASHKGQPGQASPSEATREQNPAQATQLTRFDEAVRASHKGQPGQASPSKATREQNPAQATQLTRFDEADRASHKGQPGQASSSKATREHPPGLEVAQAHLDSSLQTGGLMVQPYVQSVETHGELSLIYIDGQFSHAIRKIPALGDYRVQEEYGGNDFPERPSAAALALGTRLMRAPLLTRPGGPLLYARLDLIEGDRGELMIVELELVEPSLFFRHHPQAAAALADALLRRL